MGDIDRIWHSGLKCSRPVEIRDDVLRRGTPPLGKRYNIAASENVRKGAENLWKDIQTVLVVPHGPRLSWVTVEKTMFEGSVVGLFEQ